MIEQKGFFRFSRVITLLIVLLCIIAATKSAWQWYQLVKEPSPVVIKAHEIIDVVQHGDVSETALVDEHVQNNWQTLLPNYEHVQNLAKQEINHAELSDVLANLPSKSDQEDFLDNLNEALVLANKEKLDAQKVWDKYFSVYQVKQREAQRPKDFDDIQRYFYVAVLGLSLMLMALFSMILVLLSIERNVRLLK